MAEDFSFAFEPATVGRARLGLIRTPHGEVPTPNFIFCATKASIKCIPSYQVQAIGADIMLSNTYHLMLRPGAKHVQARGGLHRFMGWNKPLFTDSGGYQIFAMGHGSVSEEIKKSSNRTLPKSLLRIEEEGVSFKSYVDGSPVFLSPEKSIEIQCRLGADLIVQFDECTPFHADKAYTKASMLRSVRWGERSIRRLRDWQAEQQNITELQRIMEDIPYAHPQAMYGVIQGGVHEDLRRESVTRVESQDFFATAVGGSLGSDKTQMYDVVSRTASLLQNPTRPVHLLGIGDIPDIFHGVPAGIDTFDCVHPTRIARHATAIVPASVDPCGYLHLRSSGFANQDIPLDPDCPLPCCRKYTRAYIHYLCKAREFLAPYLLTVHNIGQMVRLMREIREALAKCAKNGHSEHFYRLKKFWTGSA